MVTGALMFIPILAALGVAMKTRDSLSFAPSDGQSIAALSLVAVLQSATCRHMAFDHVLFAALGLGAVAVLAHGRGALSGAISGAWGGLAFASVAAIAYPANLDTLDVMTSSGSFSALAGLTVPLTLASVGAFAGSRSCERIAFLAPLIWLAIPMVLYPDLLRLPGTYVVPLVGCTLTAALLATLAPASPTVEETAG